MRKLSNILFLIMLIFLTGASRRCPTVVQACDQPIDKFKGRSFSLYVLSRGKGVPDASWEVFERIRELFHGQKTKGTVIKIRETRIGIEGERRICADFISEDAACQAWEQAEEITAGVELVNLKIERCPP